MSGGRRVAVVTGGASGIGRATVERLVGDGWNVVVADLNQANGDALVRDLTGTGGTEGADRGQVDFVRTDVSDEGSVEAAVARAQERFGRIDAMVNNAGVGGAFGPITELELEDWEYTFSIVSRGVFLGTKYAARAMTASGRGGSIVNTGSLAGISGGAGPQAYSAAKAGVINFTRSVAVELAAHRVRVNSVSPGFIRTPILGTGVKKIERLLGDVQPWPEVGEPTHVASVIAFLVGPDSAFVTGESINVDGGVTAAGPRVGDTIGGDPAARGLVGVARGSTGHESTVRRRTGPGTAQASG
ncbi:SDR family NAD(P)-dependent oxidoreductase [Pseudonocardia endophytica]|uniref:NAD(P)-dependent dehydrogenase (Short-subunit alcohol dehydrogenase family) n=1 Tax=Pseudonocardia endophytica TaxID=401976 RepID=A0A4V2PHU2_PSEEN|nr:SDR family oxidoreductase [Pseudonocardia endophytica]TCK22106.1 NAD(P)-dependent dehydrogenase (short-subunit alcohol dehydrogenase family) [Pseudonocardia endophytica]